MDQSTFVPIVQVVLGVERGTLQPVAFVNFAATKSALDRAGVTPEAVAVRLRDLADQIAAGDYLDAF